jgi:hypothetical protein
MRPARYEIVVLGELSHRFGLAFRDMEVHTHADRTTISGWVVDQAQLHGLIDRVGELGLELLDVRVVEVYGGGGLLHGSSPSGAPDRSSGAL